MAPPPQVAIDGIPEAVVEEEVEPWVPSSDSEPEPDSPTLQLPDPSPASSKPELLPAQTSVAEGKGEEEEARQRWPGASVFRVVVPADQVGGVIGRRGSTIKCLCDETRARVRVLDAAAHGAAANRIVLVSATEEVEAELSPAMNAAIKIFKHINGIEDINSDGTLYASAPEICSVRLLVPAAQAIHLIGKQGVTIKSIHESTGATIRIIDEDELLSCERPDERIVEIHGASLKVHNALKSVLGLLRRFLVDHGVLHLFDMKNQEVAQPQDTSKENQFIDDYPLAVNHDFLLYDQRSHCNPIGSGLLYGQDPFFCDPYCSSDISHATDSLMTQITQTMKIPLPYAEEIIGVRGENIEFIRSVSGAVVVLEEIGGYPDEVLVMIKGSSSQVQTAHQLLQEVLSGNREPPPPPRRSCYRDAEAGPRLPSSPPPRAASRMLNSPHAGPSWWPHPPPHAAIATSREYLPWHYEDEPPGDHRRYPAAHHDHRG